MEQSYRSRLGLTFGLDFGRLSRNLSTLSCGLGTRRGSCDAVSHKCA
jgi:hypothetical protein